MPAGQYNFAIEKGTTFRKTITWKDSVGNPVNLAGYSAKLQLRDKAGGSVFLELSTTNGRISFNPAFGQILLYIAAPDTSTINARKCVYDLELVAPNTDVTRLLQGKVTISEEITV